MRDGLVAFGAASVATGLEAVGRFAWDGPWLAELMAQKLFVLIPPWAFTPLFRVFGYNSKYYAFAGMVAAEVGLLTLVGTLLRGWTRTRRAATGRTPWLDAVGAALGLAVLILVVALPLLDAGVAGQALPGGAWVTVPTVVVVVGCYVGVLTRGVMG